MKMVALQILLALGLLSHHVSGYAGGAPPSKPICEKMIPGHGKDPQTTPFPYIVNVDKATLKGGETAHITLSAPNGESFVGMGKIFLKISWLKINVFLILGFLVMVKKAGDGLSNVGRFNATYDPEQAQSLSCFDSSRSAMTHRSNKPKTQVTVEWVAPNEDLANLEIT